MSALFVALRKDRALMWANRTALAAVFMFGVTTLLLLSFAIGPRADLLRPYAASFLWLALLLLLTLALADSFSDEMREQRSPARCSCRCRHASSTTRRRSRTPRS